MLGKRLLRKSFFGEPLVHFVVLAGFLFALEHFLSSKQKEQIVVDQQTVNFLIKQREDLELRTLSAEERRQVINSFIEEEILYREAYKRGLDKGDSRMRRNLILKMRGLFMGEIKSPSETELKEYFQDHRHQYRRPATFSLEHVLFKDSSNVPKGLLDELREGREYQSIGESVYPYGRKLVRVSARDLVPILGPKIAKQISALTDRQWHGPFESNNGTHFVRIVDQWAAENPRYEDVRPYIVGEWPIIQSQATIEQEVNKLREQYLIVVEEEGIAP